MPKFWRFVHHLFHEHIVSRTLTLNGIGRQGKGRARKADQRNFLGQAFVNTAHGVGDVRRVLNGRRRSEIGHIGCGANRVIEYWALTRHIFEIQTHGFQDGQQVSKHDRRIYTENALGVQGSLGCLFRIFEKIQAGQIRFDLMIFGHVTTCLTIQPNRRMRGLFTPAGL